MDWERGIRARSAAGRRSGFQRLRYDRYRCRGIEDHEEVYLELHIDEGHWEPRHQNSNDEGATQAALEALVADPREEQVE